MIEIIKNVNAEAINEAKLLVSSFKYLENNLIVNKDSITIKCQTKMRVLDILEDFANCPNLYKYFKDDLEKELN